MADTLLTRLFLDAQDQFRAAIDHIPAPGRGGAIGPLNPAAWTIADLASQHHEWVNIFAAGGEPDLWAQRWIAESTPVWPKLLVPPLEESVALFDRASKQAGEWVQHASWETLCEPADAPGWPPVTRGYFIASAIAHIYVHAGHLSVLASLMAAGDMGLPGPLTRATRPTTEDDPTIPIVAALLRDGYGEVARVMDVIPKPAAHGAMDRLNPLSHDLLHLVGREDRLWNVACQDRKPSPNLAALGVTGEARPQPWDTTRTAFRKVLEATEPWLDTLDGPTAAQPMQWRTGPSSVGAQIARSAGHFFAHAGDMMSHSSLYGVQDIGMPGKLAHVATAFARTSS